MTFSTPAAVQQRLDAIEEDLAKRQNEYEEAAGQRARLVRDWEKRLAIARKVAKGNDADARKAAALVAAAEHEDENGNLYDRLSEAEGTFEACKAAIRVMETRVGIGQSILKAQGRG